MEYKDKIKIDEDALDIECLNQAENMLDITSEMANCQSTMDNLKDALDVIKAELDFKIRKNFGEYGLDKTTDALVANTVLRQEEYQEASAEYLEAKHAYQTAKGAVDAFEQRKSMIEALIKLHGQQYFAGPKIPRNLHDERAEQRERKQRSDAKVGMKLKRRKV